MKNDMKLIMENWRRNLQEKAEQSDGGLVLTPKEMDEVSKILKSKVEPELKKVQQQMLKDLEDNKDKIKQLEKNGQVKELNEAIFASLWTAIKMGALIGSLAQLLAKIATSVSSYFGRVPFVDPENTDDKYWNEMHMKVHKGVDHFKRSIASFGIYPLIKLIIEKFVSTPETKKKLNQANEILADVMAFAAVGVAIFNSWENFKTALKGAQVLNMFKAAFETENAYEAVASAIDNAVGLKDFLITIFEKVFGQTTP